MASAVDQDYSSESDDDCSYYSGQAKRFQLEKRTMFPLGLVKLVESPEPAAVQVVKPSAATSSKTDDDIAACKKSNKSKSAANKVVTLEDIEDCLDLSADLSFSPSLCAGVESCPILDNPDLSFSPCLRAGPILDNVPAPAEHSAQELLVDCDEAPGDSGDKIVVKVRFRSQLHRIELLKEQYFKTISHELCEKYKVAHSTIVLYLNNRLLDGYDTRKKVPISITDIIDAYSTASDVVQAPVGASGDTLQLKVQSKERGSAITISIGEDDRIQVLMDKYAEQTGHDAGKLCFFFDGEPLKAGDTRQSL